MSTFLKLVFSWSVYFKVSTKKTEYVPRVWTQPPDDLDVGWHQFSALSGSGWWLSVRRRALASVWVWSVFHKISRWYPCSLAFEASPLNFSHRIVSNYIFNVSTINNFNLKSVLVTQLCLTLSDPMDYRSLPGSFDHGVFQARILEWVAIPFSRASSWPRDRTWVSCIAESLPSELPEF